MCSAGDFVAYYRHGIKLLGGESVKKRMHYIVNSMRISYRLLYESISFTLNQLKANKFRTLLSLLGVTIGIFSIVAIFTAIDSLQANVKTGLKGLNMNSVEVSRWPSGGDDEEDGMRGGEFRWWDYLKRKPLLYSEFKFLEKHLTGASAKVVFFSINGTAKYKGNSTSDIFCMNDQWSEISTMKMSKGRFFSRLESESFFPIALVGEKMAEHLFGSEDPIDKRIKIKGQSFKVIGVVSEDESSIVRVSDFGNTVIIPLAAGLQMIDPKSTEMSMIFSPKDGTTIDELASEIKMLLRGIRRIAPGEKSDFSVNKLTFLADALDELFGTLNMVGWILASFSLLIGGFGIINIMYVSVKERTKIIGIQKALGAKRHFILAQFLFEALMLSLLGGVIGVLLVVVIASVIPSDQIVMTFSSMMAGLGIASVIGILSGILPAMQAAKLDPVVAINSK